MNRIVAGLAFLLLFSITTKAQVTGTPHSATINCTAPNPVGGSGTIAGFNFYRAVPPSTTYTKLTATTVPTCSYKDSAVANGTTYSWQVTTVDSSGNESLGSAPVQGTTLTNPNPPTAPTITLAQLTINTDGTETALVKFTDAPNQAEVVLFFDGSSKILGQRIVAASTVSSFAQNLTVPSGTVIWASVCNSLGACSSQQAM